MSFCLLPFAHLSFNVSKPCWLVFWRLSFICTPFFFPPSFIPSGPCPSCLGEHNKLLFCLLTCSIFSCSNSTQPLDHQVSPQRYLLMQLCFSQNTIFILPQTCFSFPVSWFLHHYLMFSTSQNPIQTPKPPFLRVQD